MQATDTQIQYTWEQDTFDNSGEYATAITVANGIHQFAAIWNPVSQTGYLGRWSPSTNKWLNLGGDFKNPINQMCTDNKGNVYLVGDRSGTGGDYVVRIFNSSSSSWSETGNNFKNPLNNIRCDAYGNVFVAGGGENIQRFTIAFNSWVTLTGKSFTDQISDMCISSNNTLFVLSSTLEGKYSVSYYDTQSSPGTAWNTIDLSGYGEVDAITCDGYGNLYFNTTSTIYVYNPVSNSFTDLKGSVPSYGDGVYVFFLTYIDNTLYFAGYGYTSEVTTSAFVKVYSYSVWTDITPPQFPKVKPPCIAINDIASYVGKSNNILVASNQNYLLDGKKLNK